jgi:PAS domain S-box-containing protein
MTCSYPTDKILQELTKASNAFLQTSDFKKATRIVYDCCKEIIGSTAGYVALLSADKSENELLFLDMSGMQCSLNPNQPMPIRGLRAEAYSSGETVYDNNFPQSEWMQYLPEGHGRLDNVLFAPLVIDNESVGIFGFANRPGGFCEDSALIARTFTEIAAVGLLQNRTVNRFETTAKQLSALMEAAHDAIITIDGHGDIFSWNNAAENLFGYSSDEMIGNSCMRIIPDQYRKRHAEAFAKVSETGISKLAGREIAIETLRKDNEMFPAELSLSKWDVDGAVYFTGIIRDISLRKKMEQETRETESRLRKVFEHMKGGGAIYKAVDDGEDFVIIDFHRPELQGLDKKSEDLRGKKILQVFPASKEFGLFEVFQRVWKTGKPETHPLKIYNDKDITGWRENYVYKLPTGEIVALYEDFTERKKMEMALQDNENLFRTIFETSPDPVNINRLKDGKFIKVNNRFLELTGFEENEVIGKTALDINIWQNLNKRKQFFSQLYEKGQIRNFAAVFKHKDGSLIMAQVSAEIISYKNEPHILVVTQDITELKKSERQLLEAHKQLQKRFVVRSEELEESRLDYQTIADYTYDWEWWERPDGTFRYVSPACERITGYKADLFIKDHSFLREIIVPEDWDKWDKHHNESHKGSGLREMQFCIKTADGDVRWIEHACQPVFTEGNVFLGFRASNRDITARKQAEQKLQKTERQYRGLINNSLVGVFSSRYSTGEFVFVNDAMAGIYDFESPEQMMAEKAVANWKDPQKREQMLAAITKHGSVNNWNAEIITSTGHHRHVLFSATLEDEIITGMVMDITMRVLAETALQSSEINLKKAQEVAHIGSWHLDLLDNNLVWTDENYRIFGIPKGSPLTYRKFLEIVHPEDRDYVDEKWRLAMNSASGRQGLC